MSAAAPTADLEPVDAVAPRAESPGRLAWRRLRRDRAALISGGFLVFLLLAVLPGAPLLGKLVGHGPNDPFPYAVDISLKPVGPWAHVPDTPSVPSIDAVTFKQHRRPKAPATTLMVLGADGSLGRDELQRLLYGGRVSLTVAIGATLLALIIGTTLGTLAAYFGGWVDSVVSRFTDLVMAFPVLLLAIVLGSTFSKKLDDVTLPRRAEPGRPVAHPPDRALHMVLPGADRAVADPLATRPRVRRGGGDDRRQRRGRSCGRTSSRT